MARRGSHTHATCHMRHTRVDVSAQGPHARGARPQGPRHTGAHRDTGTRRSRAGHRARRGGRRAGRSRVPRRIPIHARGLRDTQTRHGKDTHAGRGSSRRGATRRGPHTVWHARDPPARGRVVSSFHRATDTCARARAGRAVDGLRSPRCTSARRPRSGSCKSGHKHACALRLITPIALRGRRACHTYHRKRMEAHALSGCAARWRLCCCVARGGFVVTRRSSRHRGPRAPWWPCRPLG